MFQGASVILVVTVISQYRQKQNRRTSFGTHTHTHAHVPQLTCHTSSHLHQIGCLSVEVEKTETQTNKNFNGISNLTLFNKLLIWSNRSQYFTNQQAKPNGKSMKKSSPNVGETPWGNHCLKGSVCLDLSVWPRSFQDHPSPIPKEFVQNNPGETSEVEQAKSNLTSTEQRMRHSNFYAQHHQETTIKM